jgi:hypothetical protein
VLSLNYLHLLSIDYSSFSNGINMKGRVFFLTVIRQEERNSLQLILKNEETSFPQGMLGKKQVQARNSSESTFIKCEVSETDRLQCVIFRQFFPSSFPWDK